MKCEICEGAADAFRNGHAVCVTHLHEPATDFEFITLLTAIKARNYVRALQGEQISKPDGDPSETWDNLILTVDKFQRAIEKFNSENN